MLGLGVAAAILVGTLFRLQVIEHSYYKTKVLDQMTVSTEVNPERGTIYDRNGNILATNSQNYLVFISPQDIIDAIEENDDADPEDRKYYTWTDSSGHEYRDLGMNELIAYGLADILGVEKDFVLEKAALKGRHYEVIKKEVSEENAAKVRLLISEFELTRQIYLRASSIRTYPYSDLASQVIGFTNKDGVGVYGIESYYNNLLEGTSGKYVAAQDAHSEDMPFEYETFIDPENGYHIESTLDVYIQYELENQLKATYIENAAAERVAGIVMNVNNGEIYAMGTYPTFDLNNPYMLDEYSQAALDAMGLASDSPEYLSAKYNLLYGLWANKAVTGLYEPGSTFKILTTAMALDEGVTYLSEGFKCTGAHYVKGYGNVHCHQAGGHGALSMAEGLQQSCNPVFMILGERLGTNLFYNYFTAFGYSGRTGIDLPAEASPIITPEKNFTGVSLAVYSFGQTFKTSPIQQIRAIAAVANGGYLVTPHVLKSIKDDDGNIVAKFSTEPVRQVVSTDAATTVTGVLEAGVSGNGGAKNAYVKGYKIAAKTGTSEKRDLIAQYGDKPHYRVGSTVAYAPAENPEVAVLILVDEPSNGVVYGSRVAAPYVANLLAYVLPYLGYEPEYTEEELKLAQIAVPDCVGSSVDGAKSDLTWRGLTVEVIGDGDTVTGQLPMAGESVTQKSGRVLLYTNGELPVADVTVPDVIGITAEAANRHIINEGLNISLTGASGIHEGAIVINQTPAAGSKVAKGTVVTIEIRYMDSTD